MREKTKKSLLIIAMVAMVPLYTGVFLWTYNSESSSLFFGDGIVENAPSLEDFEQYSNYTEKMQAYQQALESYYDTQYVARVNVSWPLGSGINHSFICGFIAYYFEDSPDEIMVQMHFPDLKSDPNAVHVDNISGVYHFNDQSYAPFAIKMHQTKSRATYRGNGQITYTPVVFVSRLNSTQSPSTPFSFDIEFTISLNLTNRYQKFPFSINFTTTPKELSVPVDLTPFWELNAAFPGGVTIFDLFSAILVIFLTITAVESYRKEKKQKRTSSELLNPKTIDAISAPLPPIEEEYNHQTMKYTSIIFGYSIGMFFIGLLPSSTLNNLAMVVLTGANIIIALWLIFTGSHLKGKVLGITAAIFVFPIYLLSYLSFTQGSGHFIQKYSFLTSFPFFIWLYFIPGFFVVVPPLFLMIDGIGRFTSVIDLDTGWSGTSKYAHFRKIIIPSLIIIFFLVIFVPWVLLIISRFVDSSSPMLRLVIPFVIRLKGQFIGEENLVSLLIVIYVFYSLIAENRSRIRSIRNLEDQKALLKCRTALIFYTALSLTFATYGIMMKITSDLNLLAKSYAILDPNFDAIYNVGRVFGLSDQSAETFYLHLLPTQFNYYGISFFADLYLYFIMLYFIIFTVGLSRYKVHRRALMTQNTKIV